MSSGPKIFCIGFQKTGTTSLGRALQVLGYNVCGPVGVTNPQFGKRAKEWAMARLPYYDAFQDNPWPLLYKDLDLLCPGSKFILTTRNPRSWIRSMNKYFGDYEAAAEVWLYGEGITPRRHPRACVKRYKQHNEEVRRYFADRPDDLLEMDFGKGHGWEELCAFLGHRIPASEFPRSNKSGSLPAELQRHTVGIVGTARTQGARVMQIAINALSGKARSQA